MNFVENSYYGAIRSVYAKKSYEGISSATLSSYTFESNWKSFQDK